MLKQSIDELGSRYGRLTVVARAENRPDSGGKSVAAMWVCACDCGGRTETRGWMLRAGKTQSCGCLRIERAVARVALPKGVSGRNRALANIKSNAARRGYEWGLTDDSALKLMQLDCFYCGSSPMQVSRGRNGSHTYNGLDRIENDKGYVDGNVVPCCGMCNSAKNRHSLDEFLAWVRRVYNHSALPMSED